jgi:hypothetical protein
MSGRNAGMHLGSWLAPRWSRGSAALARPAMTAAAIRIPERVSAQLALVFPSAAPQLFVHEGARQALERKLKAASPGRLVVLSITDNRHSIISHSVKHGVLHARIHHMFLDAPARVVDALVRYVVRGDRKASQLVGNYIEANGARLARRRPRAIPLVAKGDHHDLLAIFNDLNAKYFDGGCTALVTWGRRVRRNRGVPRKAIRLGSYSSLERLIRIHPVLDRSWVPRYFVAYVLYHEMLHHMIPSARGSARAASANLASANGHIVRRVLHPPEFVERERGFRRYERALEWEKRHIGRLLRAS